MKVPIKLFQEDHKTLHHAKLSLGPFGKTDKVYSSRCGGPSGAGDSPIVLQTVAGMPRVVGDGGQAQRGGSVAAECSTAMHAFGNRPLTVRDMLAY